MAKLTWRFLFNPTSSTTRMQLPLILLLLPFVSSLSADGGSTRRQLNAGSSCPTECQCQLPVYAVCAPRNVVEKARLPQLPAEVIKVRLSGYTVAELPREFSEHLTQLKFLELSKIPLTRLPAYLPSSLLSLQLSQTQIRKLGDDEEETSLATMAPQLQSLNVSFNGHLSSISELTLRGLVNLRELTLSHNPITTIHHHTFQTLEKLSHLDVSYTKINAIHAYWFVGTRHLKALNMSHCNLRNIPESSFSTLGELEQLDLSYNRLSTIYDRNFDLLKALIYLDISHNNVTKIGEAVFAGLSSLEYLNLSYNSIVNLDEFVFVGNFRLKQLHMSNLPQLVRIEHGSFTGLTELQELYLNDCPKLYEIEEVAFAGLNHLHKLDMSRTSLPVLPLSVTFLSNITQLNLHQTGPLLCDCHMWWLPKWLKQLSENGSVALQPVLCSGTTTTGGDWDRVVEVDQLASILEEMDCHSVQTWSEQNVWSFPREKQSALLDCNVTGQPAPNIIWLTNQQKVFLGDWNPANETWLSHPISQVAALASNDSRFKVLKSGHLHIENVTRSDMGRYKCFAFNSVSNTSVVAFVALSSHDFRNLIIFSALFGWACAFLFLSVTLIVQLVIYIWDRIGCECYCCCKDRLPPKMKKINKILQGIESYRTKQLETLRENYSAQAGSIRDGCYQQLDKLRDSYQAQHKYLKELKDYSSQQLSDFRDYSSAQLVGIKDFSSAQLHGLRESYLDQANRVREYSVSQLTRVRENYLFQRIRVRKYSTQQLFKIRETYKYQQKYLNKILENLPDFYIQNCRTGGGCQRTDSLMFDEEITGLDAYCKLKVEAFPPLTDYFDIQSQSDYYTPTSTLNRSLKSNKGDKKHSRQSSGGSGECFLEANPWFGGGVKKNDSPAGHTPTRIGRFWHSRSRSVSQEPSPAIASRDPVKIHRRSHSSGHPSIYNQNIQQQCNANTQKESSGGPTKISEEGQLNSLADDTNIKNERPQSSSSSPVSTSSSTMSPQQQQTPSAIYCTPTSQSPCTTSSSYPSPEMSPATTPPAAETATESTPTVIAMATSATEDEEDTLLTVVVDHDGKTQGISYETSL